jgi:glycosyltransferase involved in cell wall biosynthesis
MKIYNKVYFHATDKIEYDRIKIMFGAEDNISILPNVPKVSDATPLTKNKDELKLIFISRIRDNKNLLLALKALSSCNGNMIFDIYGPIEDQEYWEKCQTTMEQLPKNIQIAYKGVVSPTEISKVMRQYHALLLPTKTENFGHVIVEAMQSGVVPIIGDQTPWVNLEEHHAGWDLDLKDIESFTNVINTLYEMDSEEYANLSKSTISFITEKLNMDELKLKYVELFEKAT